MRTKICSHCHKKKKLSAFNTDGCSKDGYSRWCHHCIDHYRKLRKETHNEVDWKIKREYRERVAEIKANQGCAHCGEKSEVCLEFHHVNAEEKIDTIPNLIKDGYDWEVIVTEMNKCIVLCANCHRKLHELEREQYEEEMNVAECGDALPDRGTEQSYQDYCRNVGKTS